MKCQVISLRDQPFLLQTSFNDPNSREETDANLKQPLFLEKDAGAVAGASIIRRKSFGPVRKKSYACDLCPKQFKKNYGLVRHYRICPGEKPFVCETCWKDFTLKKGNLDRHARTQTGFFVKFVEEDFSIKSNFNTYVATHD
ncbi:unnamed protein product [Larinioides sclopetarius]|uniref:C2H2-type domain-containing protein n=1 Tax=Larinioides sclopetarius TaxID=280406 RepID=A0AAV2C048_9ARAC